MSLASTHLLYDARSPDWEQMVDTFDGERAVKEARERYLHPTSSMRADGWGRAETEGELRYQAYVARAVFPELVREAVEGLVGAMHRKPATFELPKALERMLERATPAGETLYTLLMRVNEAQLLYGRIGLLVDVPTGRPAEGVVPWIVSYDAPSILNWYEGAGLNGEDELQMVVLDESEPVMSAELVWQVRKRYRLLALNETQLGKLGDVEGRVYVTGVTEYDSEQVPSSFTTPMVRDPLTKVPFVFVNSVDLVAAPVVPPLMFLSNLALAIYRGEADYRNALFVQGQETLVVAGALQSGDGGDTTVGAGARIDVTEGGSASYVGVSGAGLSEQRLALENDYDRAEARAGQVLAQKGSSAESGDALTIRVASRTATLARIAVTGAAGLEMALRHAGRFMGLSDEQLAEISVRPNTDFADDGDVTSRVIDLVTAANAGAPLSRRTIHDLCRRWDLTAKTFEDEIAEIEQEKTDGIGPPMAPAAPPVDDDPEPEPEPEPEDDE
jgi:hypothetical protein